jgi:hypothetical protein
MDPQVDSLTDDLTDEFAPNITREAVQRVVEDTLGSLEDARIKSFVPVLARRIARDQLRSLTRRPA